MENGLSFRNTIDTAEGSYSFLYKRLVRLTATGITSTWWYILQQHFLLRQRRIGKAKFRFASDFFIPNADKKKMISKIILRQTITNNSVDQLIKCFASNIQKLEEKTQQAEEA